MACSFARTVGGDHVILDTVMNHGSVSGTMMDALRSGTIGWVVADNGRFGGQPLWAAAEDVARSLMQDRPVARPWDR